MRVAGITFVSIIVAGGIAVFSSKRGVQSWSIGTAYTALFLAAGALVTGPINLIRARPNPVHNPLRRDIGISAGLMATLHTILGLQVHMGGDLARYFLRATAQQSATGYLFLGANWAGLGSVLVFAFVTVISNDPSLRSLGLQTWKRVQRFIYPAAFLAVIHGFAYQALEKRSVGAIVLVAVLTLVVLVLQLAGVILHHRSEALRLS